MSTSLDERLTATLRDHAGGDVDPTPLVEGARSRGRRLRLRRRGFLAGSAAAACVTLAALVSLVPLGQDPDPPIQPAARLAPPAAPGQPGATARPDLVGADPHVVHFTTDALIDNAQLVTWSAGRGTESVEFGGPTGGARFVLARAERTLRTLRQTLSSSGQPGPPIDTKVEGSPAVGWVDPGIGGGPDLWFVRWQPGDGLWAQLDIQAASLDEAVAAATRVRFDVAHRCVVPFRLTTLPTGAGLLECSVEFGARRKGGGVEEGRLVVGDADRWLTVRIQHLPVPPRTTGELAAGPYRVRRQGSEVLETGVRPYAVEAFLRGRGRGYTESEGLTVLGGFRLADKLDQPDTW